MVLYDYTKATWMAVITNDALMEGEYLAQSFKSTSTQEYQRFPAKTSQFCSAPLLLCAGCMAVSVCIYFRHNFSLQKRSNLLLWLRASPLPPRYLCAQHTDCTTDRRRVVPSPLAARLTCLWTKLFWRLAQLLRLSVGCFIQICICFYIKMMFYTAVITHRTKEKQALCISSNSVVRTPLLVSTQKKSGFPDIRASRRNSCSQYSQLGNPSSDTFQS